MLGLGLRQCLRLSLNCGICKQNFTDDDPLRYPEVRWLGDRRGLILFYYAEGHCPLCRMPIEHSRKLELKIINYYKLYKEGKELLKPPRSKKFFVHMEREGTKTQMWRGWVDGDQVVSQWGIKDGKIQETIDIPGSKGKKGTKAFITPEDSAVNDLVRDVKKKAQKGYEIITGPSRGPFADMLEQELGDVTKATEIDFSGPLPNNVAFSKPQNSVEPKKLMKLAAREQQGVGGPPLVWTVKKNGMCYIVTKDRKEKVWIQSRGKLIIENDKFPHLVEAFDSFLPPSSIILCEFYVGKGNTKKDFTAMQQISNSLVGRALEMQEQLGKVHAYVFRVPFYLGKNYEKDSPCTVWLSLLNSLIDGWDPPDTPPGIEPWGQSGLAQYEFIHGPAISDDTYEEAIEEMERFGYEGWVVYDCWNSLGEKHISFKGQPDRPNVCWKVKKALEDDFIGLWDPRGDGMHCTSKCRVPDQKSYMEQGKTKKCCVCGKRLKPDGTFGTGKNKERVGTLSLYQYGADGVKRYVCEVSSGLTDDQKQKIADEGFCVETVVIGYQDRGFITQGDDSNALQHPKVLGFREDKELNECVSEEV